MVMFGLGHAAIGGWAESPEESSEASAVELDFESASGSSLVAFKLLEVGFAGDCPLVGLETSGMLAAGCPAVGLET